MSPNVADDVHLDAASKIMDRISKLEATIKEQNDLMDRLPHWHYIGCAPQSAEGDVGDDIQSASALTSENQQYIHEPEILETTITALNTARRKSPPRSSSPTHLAYPSAESNITHRADDYDSRPPISEQQSLGSCTDRTAFRHLIIGSSGSYVSPRICEPTTLSSLTSESKVEDTNGNAGELPKTEPAAASHFKPAEEAEPPFSTSETLPLVGGHPMREVNLSEHFYLSSVQTRDAAPSPAPAEIERQGEDEKLFSESFEEARFDTVQFAAALGTAEVHFDVPSLLSIFENKRSQRQSQAKYLNHRLDQLVKERERKLKQLHDLEIEVTQLRSKLMTNCSSSGTR